LLHQIIVMTQMLGTGRVRLVRYLPPISDVAGRVVTWSEECGPNTYIHAFLRCNIIVIPAQQ